MSAMFTMFCGKDETKTSALHIRSGEKFAVLRIETEHSSVSLHMDSAEEIWKLGVKIMEAAQSLDTKCTNQAKPAPTKAD